MQVIVRPIGIIATVFLMSGEIIPYEGWGLFVLGGLVILGIIAFIICFKNADKINKYLKRFFDSVSNFIFRKR